MSRERRGGHSATFEIPPGVRVEQPHKATFMCSLKGLHPDCLSLGDLHPAEMVRLGAELPRLE